MADQLQTEKKVPIGKVFTPVPSGLLQRKCACGNHSMADGECGECAKKKGLLHRKLTIGASNDPLEQEADRVADQVMTLPLNSAINYAPPRIQCFSGQAGDGLDATPPSVDRVLASSGNPLEQPVGWGESQTPTFRFVEWDIENEIRRGKMNTEFMIY